MKKIFALILTFFLILNLAACSFSSNTNSVDAASAETASTASVDSTAGDETESGSGTGTLSTAESVATAMAENSEVDIAAVDVASASSSAVPITLNGDSIAAADEKVTVEGSTATIASAGAYSLSGTLTNGQIIVDTTEEDTVVLILDGVEINSSTSSAIYVKNAKTVAIVLADGSVNTLSDGSSYVLAAVDENEPNAAVFTKSDLTIAGNGSLTVQGNYEDGIVSKDGLVISGGTIRVQAVDDGIRGKDYVAVTGGSITITSGGDGLKSDNETDAGKGFVSIQGGSLDIDAGGDAVTAQTDVLISGGTFNLVSGGGSGNIIDTTLSAKGIKGVVSVVIDGGTFTVNSADDTLHSNGSILINGGTFALTSGDDGMHADSSLTINSGEYTIYESYEGIESAQITINGGTIHINSSDDGINVAGGGDGSGFAQGPGFGGGNRGGGQVLPPGQTGDAGQVTAPNQDTFAANSSYMLYINGGTTYVDAYGDGIDVNGGVEMTNGSVVVNGPVENMNGALDYGSGFSITGGFLVAAGSAGMSMAPDQSSSVYSIQVNFSASLPAGTLVNIQSSDGENVLTFAPTKTFQSIVVASPDIANGSEYIVSYGGNSTGSAVDGLYEGESYSGGTDYVSLTISSVVTSTGVTGGGGRGR